MVIVLWIFVVLCLGCGLWRSSRALRLKSLEQRTETRLSGFTEVLPKFVAHFSVGEKASSPIFEALTVAGITAVDYVWSWANIDPDVIHAAAFSSHASIHNGFQFAEFIYHHYDSLSERAKDGFYNRLLGYVGEQEASHILQSQGHLVQVAQSARQPIWDFQVDHHPVNVKTVHDIGQIKLEALKHPNVIYDVPTDAHGHAVQNIQRLSDFSHNHATQSLSHAIQASDGATAFHLLVGQVPWFTVGFALQRQYVLHRKGKPLCNAFQDAATESVVVGTSVIVGAKVGGVIGATLGPIGSLLGAATGGSAGAYAGRKGCTSLADYRRKKIAEAVRVQYQDALEMYGREFEHRIPEIEDLITSPSRHASCALGQIQSEFRTRSQKLVFKIWPDFYTVLLQKTIEHGENELGKLRMQAEEVLGVTREAVATNSFASIGRIMLCAPEVAEIIGDNPSMREKLIALRQQIAANFNMSKQSSPV